MGTLYSVIIPVYNEEEVVEATYKRLTRVMESMNEDYEMIFVNDGSQDRTPQILEELSRNDSHVRMLDFSRNFGHQIAITAGMDYAEGDAIVIIDADLQDPPELIPQMAAKWKEGCEVVYGKRIKREGETIFKKWTAALFYRLLHSLTDIDIPVDTGDFRLMDRNVCLAMRGIREKNRFVRGLVSWVGFRQAAVEYVREERAAGATKYQLKKMLRLAMNGVASFSDRPLKISTYLGTLVMIASLAGLLLLMLPSSGALWASGWPPLMAGLMFMNGAILVVLGMIGEYIGRIYDETRNRPLYILRNQADWAQSGTSGGEKRVKQVKRRPDHALLPGWRRQYGN